MKLSYALYNHLASLKIFEPIKQANKNPIILNESQQNLVENGIAVAKLLKSIYNLKQEISQRTLTPIAQLDHLKQVTTSSTKLYNWNIILTAMNQLQIPNEINADIKKLILMGDVQIIEDTIQQMFEFYLKLQQSKLSKPKASPNVRNRILSEQQPQSQGYNHLNLSQSNDQNPISDSNTLEYFTQLLSKWLNLQYKQVISLYAENFKFWAQIVTKGVQRVYEPILGVYKDIFLSIDHLQNLIAIEKDKALGFSLNLLKPGLVSKSPEVCIETIRTFGNFVIQAYNNKISYTEDIYRWYVDNCFQTTLLSIKRHPQLVDSLVDLMILFCKHHLVDLFTTILKQHSANNIEMLVSVEKLFSSLTPEYVLEIQSMGIMQQWLEQGLEIMQGNNNLKTDDKISILRLLYNIWLKNQYPDYSNRLQNVFKLATHDSRLNVAIFALQFLFKALEYFGKNKIPEAPIIYKIIAIELVELSNEYLVHFILQNLLIVFQTIPQIPLSIVLDPFIVSLLEKNYPSLVVFQFLGVVATNPNLTTKSQIHLMDLLSKISIYDTLHYRISSQIFLQLVTNTQQSPSTQEFINKFVKVSLAVYFSVYKKSENKKPNSQIADKQRKAQIIELLKGLLQINNPNFNSVIKVMAGHTNLQFKMYQKPNKGLQVLLSLLGDVNEIMQQVELEYQEAQTNKQVYSDASVKEVQQVQNNLKKFSKIKLTKEEQYHLAKLRMPKETDPKVLNDISTIKKQFKEKQQEKEIFKINQDEQMKIQKDKLRKQLEKRQIEQGIASLNQKDVMVKLIFPDGSRQNELAKEKKNGLPTFELLDLNLEEEIDKLLVEQLLRKYSKVLRFLFTKYANTCQLQQPNSFEQYHQKAESINLAEINKLVHEYEIAISVEHVQALARQVGTQILTKTEFKEFDQIGFNHFVIQLSIVLSKNKLADIQPHQCLNKLITHLRNVTASKGQSTALFDDPESQYFMENDIIKEYNQQLLLNPDYELPQGYKKVSTFEIQFSYDIPLIEDKFNISYQIINDIVKDVIGINLIEPLSKKVLVYKAKPDAFGYIQSKLQAEPTDDQYKIKSKKSKDVNLSLQKKKVLEIEPKRELSLNMKLAIAKCSLKDKYIAENVANLLDDMLFAIEHNKQQANRNNPISNKVIEDKKQFQMEQELQEQKREQQRRLREKDLKEKLKEDREKQKQFQEQLDKERIEKTKTEIQLKREMDGKRLNYLTEQKQKIKEKNEKEKEEQLKRIIEDNQIKEKEIKLKQHNFQEFNQKQINKLKEIISQGQNKQQQSLKEQQEKLKKQQLLLQQARSKILTQDQSRIVEQRNLEKDIETKFKSQSYQKIIDKYQFGLNYLFQFLIKETFQPVGHLQREQISFKTYAWFADRFNISPEIISKDDVLQLFRQLTRNKEIVDGQTQGMNYDQFLQSLHRISIKGFALFSKADITQIKKVVEVEQIISPLEPQSHSPKTESQIAETPLRNKSKSNYLESSKILKELQINFQQSNEQTFEYFLLYLDISNDKNQLDQRFRKTLEEKKVPTKLRKKILQEKLGIQI